MSQSQSQSQFSVIGAGPVGLATALLLNKLGYGTTIYESQDSVVAQEVPVYDRSTIGLNGRDT